MDVVTIKETFLVEKDQIKSMDVVTVTEFV